MSDRYFVVEKAAISSAGSFSVIDGLDGNTCAGPFYWRDEADKRALHLNTIDAIDSDTHGMPVGTYGGFDF